MEEREGGLCFFPGHGQSRKRKHSWCQLSAWEHRFLQAPGAVPVPSLGRSQLLGLFLMRCLVHSSCGQRLRTWAQLFCRASSCMESPWGFE